MMAKDNDVGFRPFDYYNPELLTNPLFWFNAFRLGVFLYFLPKLSTIPALTAHTTFRYPEDKKDLVEKARKMAGSRGLNGLQLELLEEFVVR